MEVQNRRLVAIHNEAPQHPQFIKLNEFHDNSLTPKFIPKVKISGEPHKKSQKLRDLEEDLRIANEKIKSLSSVMQSLSKEPENLRQIIQKQCKRIRELEDKLKQMNIERRADETILSERKELV